MENCQNCRKNIGINEEKGITHRGKTIVCYECLISPTASLTHLHAPGQYFCEFQLSRTEEKKIENKEKEME